MIRASPNKSTVPFFWATLFKIINNYKRPSCFLLMYEEMLLIVTWNEGGVGVRHPKKKKNDKKDGGEKKKNESEE